MKLVTANIKSNPLMRQSSVESDVRQVKSTGAGVILWQEIAPQRYKNALRETFPRRLHVGLSTENPITYKPWYWEKTPYKELPDFSDAPKGLFPHGVRRAAVVKMHGGRSHVTPTRYVSYVILTRKTEGAKPVVYMGTHMVSGAFSNKYPLTKKWRRSQWNVHFRKQRRMVRYFVSKGLTVIGGGDLNRGGDTPKYHPDQRWLSHGGIDHLWCVEAKGGAQVKVHTDHNPRVVRLTVE